MTEHKALADVQVKNEDRGEVRAIFSRFDAVDADGDVTRRGAFPVGAEVPISAYGHQSWAGAAPIGKGRIGADSETAWIDGRFFLSTSAGRDTFAAIKELGTLGQWSYGFDIEDSGIETVDGQQVRVLKRLRVHEVSPVLRGAGVNTMTLSAKSHHGGAVPCAEHPHDSHDEAVGCAQGLKEFLRFCQWSLEHDVHQELAEIAADFEIEEVRRRDRQHLRDLRDEWERGR